MKIKIESNKYYLPKNKVDNNDLNKDNPEWDMLKISEKTGIQTRWIAGENETALDLAVRAGNLLLNSSTNVDEIDLLILVTQSPDYFLPTSACILQDTLGLKKNCMAFDVNLGCSGFVYALAIAGAIIESGVAKKGLVICADTYSKYIDKKDRTCRPVFSDGASATLISSSNDDQLGPFVLGTDGHGFDKLIVEKGASRNPHNINEESNNIRMSGADVFLFTLNTVPSCINELLLKSSIEISDVDLFVFHQASKIVIDNLIRSMSLDEKKVFINLENTGNTVSASIPIALKDAEDSNRIQDGDLIMLVGFGVGLSWGATLVKWSK